MNSFDYGRKIEERSIKMLMPTLDGRFEYLEQIEELEQQRTLGDFKVWDEGKIKYLELKSELANKYKNFYIETWSNQSKGIKGWFYKLESDYLGYHFLEENVLYLMKFDELRMFLNFQWKGQKVIEHYPEKPQSKYEQHNDAYGRCIPIKLICYYLNVEIFDIKNGTKRTSKESYRKD